MVYEPVLSGTPHSSCSQYVVGTTQSYVPVVGCWPLIRVMTLPEEFGFVSHSATAEPLGAFCALHEIRSVCPCATESPIPGEPTVILGVPVVCPVTVIVLVPISSSRETHAAQNVLAVD